MKFMDLEIDNSKNSAIHFKKTVILSKQWKDPGAKLYDQLLNAHHIVGNRVPDDSEEFKELIKTGKYLLWQDYLKEAYLVAPVSDIKNSPYGVTPYSRSGCKYPHHVIKNGKLVVSIPGLRAAYITARNQGCFHPDHSKRPPYSRELVKHLNRHFKELKLKPEWHYGEFYLFDESMVTIGEYMDDIYSFIMGKTGVSPDELITENWIIPERDFKINMHEWRPGNPLWITGSSGDGKSTMAEKIANSRHAIVVTSDVVLMRMLFDENKYNKVINGINNHMKAHKIHLENSPAVEYVNLHPELKYNSPEDVINKEMIKFYMWLMKVLRDDDKYKNNMYVIEGSSICELDPELMSSKPLIIVGGSRLRSLYNRAKRMTDKKDISTLRAIFLYMREYNDRNRRLDDVKDAFKKNIKKQKLSTVKHKNQPDDIVESADGDTCECIYDEYEGSKDVAEQCDQITELNNNLSWIECAANGDGKIVDILFNEYAKHYIYEGVNVTDGDTAELSIPKQTDAAELDKNGVRRKKLYIAFIEWCKSYNNKNVFGSIFDKDAFKVTYPFVPNEMRYFYRLANPILCVLGGELTFFQASELRKVNEKNPNMNNLLIFAATPKDLRIFNNSDKKIYLGLYENDHIVLNNVLGDTFDTYIQNMINQGDILNGPVEESVNDSVFEGYYDLMNMPI